jgi:DNA-binding CsgD family transcriptional regulator
MRLQDYLDISEAPDLATFRRRMISFAHWMDFPIVGAVVVKECEAKGVGFKYMGYVGNRSPDFVAGTDRQLLKIDPVITQLRRSDLPFVYDQKYYVDAGAPELWEIAAPFGYRTGISVAFRISSDQRLLVGLDRERDLPADPAQSRRLLSNLERFAAYAADGAQRFVDNGWRESNRPNLTAREREILLRVLEGKSNWVIAYLMNLSENTVKFHLKNIYRKLDVSSRVVAATRANSLGLL